jgi:hypothetical protein
MKARAARGGEAADDFAAEAVEHRSHVEPVRESAQPALEVRVGRDENMFLTTRAVRRAPTRSWR